MLEESIGMLIFLHIVGAYAILKKKKMEKKYSAANGKRPQRD